MTAGQLATQILGDLGESAVSPTFYTFPEVLGAINEAQRLFCLLTLCLERTVTLELSANTTFYSVLTLYTDWIVPLRLRIAGGAKLAPGRLTDFDAISETWQADRGTPERYACSGFDLLALYKAPAAIGTTLSITYARSPVEMATAGETPEIPEEYHPDLAHYAIPRLRAKEGGQEFQKVAPRLGTFIEAAQKMAAFVRARNKAQRYDRVPVELKRFDISKLLEAING